MAAALAPYFPLLLGMSIFSLYGLIGSFAVIHFDLPGPVIRATWKRIERRTWLIVPLTLFCIVLWLPLLAWRGVERSRRRSVKGLLILNAVSIVCFWVVGWYLAELLRWMGWVP